jgi:hypothetical protein
MAPIEIKIRVEKKAKTDLAFEVLNEEQNVVISAVSALASYPCHFETKISRNQKRVKFDALKGEIASKFVHLPQQPPFFFFSSYFCWPFDSEARDSLIVSRCTGTGASSAPPSGPANFDL